MLKCFYPDEWIDSTYEIDFEKLYQLGYRHLIFDIDNTLVFHGAPQNEDSLRLLERIKSIGFNFLFLSNNKEPRVKSFADPVGAKYIFKAHKPIPKNYIKACEKLGGGVSDTVFIGDQIFTDIWGAKKAKIHTILVKPLDKKEPIQVVLKRRLEWIVLFFYKRSLKKSGKGI